MKKLFLILTIYLASTVAHGQAPNWLWAKSAGDSSTDVAQAVTTDVNNNSYIVGEFYSSSIVFGSTTLINANSANYNCDMFIAKYDNNGNPLWAKRAGGSDVDEATSIISDALGNTYVVGYFFSTSITFGSTTLTNANTDADIFVVKYDASGNVLWAKKAGGAGTDVAYSATIDASGNIYVGGYFANPSATFGSTTLTSAGFLDMFLAKYDSNGNVLWAKQAGGNESDEATSVILDTAGNIYVTGWFYSPFITFGSTTLFNTDNTGSSIDMFIVKYNSLGNVLWAKSASGGSGDEAANSVTLDASNNAYVVGNFTSPSFTFGSITLTNSDNSGSTVDMFIVKYDAIGNVQWAKSTGGSNDNDGASSVTTDTLGNIFVTGNFGSPSITFGSFTLTNSGVFVVKYGVTGNVMWAKSADSGNGGATSISLDASTNIYITGGFNSATIVFGSDTLSNIGGQDIFLTKLSSIVTGIENEKIKTEINIFPNPFTTQTTFQTDNSFHNATLTVDNCFGQTVAQIKNISGQTIVFNRDNLSSGLYFVRLTEENKTIALDKLVITDK